MKKLLAKERRSIYSLGPAFRSGEQGERHQSEFMMLEWYRLGLDLLQLEVEIGNLIATLCEAFGKPFSIPQRVSYQALFLERFGINPHVASRRELQELLDKNFPDLVGHIHPFEATPNDLLDSLFSFGIEPNLVTPTFVFDFPASQASLAKIRQRDHPVALRTELFWQGMELANGYDELRDGQELRLRIQQDNLVRESAGLPVIEVDEALIVALDELPECTGVALGVDRLLMIILGAKQLADVQSFQFL